MFFLPYFPFFFLWYFPSYFQLASLSLLLQHITVQLVVSITPPCANYDMFSCSNYPKLKRNWQTVLTSSTFHAILTLENQISLRHALTHFAKHSLAILLFQVFQDPLSGNVIGLHAMWIFIIPRFLIINSGNKQSHITSFCQNHS